MSTVTVDRKVNSDSWEDFDNSENYSQQEFKLPLLIGFWWLWKLQPPWMSTPTVDRTLTASTVVNSRFWRNFVSSESYSRQECQLPLLQALKLPSVVGHWPTLSQFFPMKIFYVRTQWPTFKLCATIWS